MYTVHKIHATKSFILANSVTVQTFDYFFMNVVCNILYVLKKLKVQMLKLGTIFVVYFDPKSAKRNINAYPSRRENFRS